MKTQEIIEKIFIFSLSIIAFYKKLIDLDKYVLSKQVLGSTTSIEQTINILTSRKNIPIVN